MIVRTAEAGDLPAIIGMAGQFHAESPVYRDQPFDPIKVHRLVSTAIGDDDWLALVAFASGGELVGMGLFFALESYFGPSIEVGDLAFYVAPSRRGSLAAAGIMERLVQWSIEKDAHCVDLGVNTGINTDKAGQFFEHCGFAKKGLLFRKVLPI